ncbi:MAG: hypothetical protein ACC652_04825, partial [Acidimicrobiales bacterium]
FELLNAKLVGRPELHELGSQSVITAQIKVARGQRPIVRLRPEVAIAVAGVIGTSSSVESIVTSLNSLGVEGIDPGAVVPSAASEAVLHWRSS